MQLFIKPLVWLSFTLSLLMVMTTALPVNDTDLLQATKPHFKQLVAALKKHHEDGIVHLGDDGVLRSFGPDLSVIDYVQLNPQQIQEAIGHHPGSALLAEVHHQADGKNVTKLEHLHEVFKDVNGEDVTEQEHLLNPGEHLLPPGFVAAMKAPKTTPNPMYPRGEIGIIPTHKHPAHDMCPGRRCDNHAECRRYPNCDICFSADRLNEGECDEYDEWAPF